MNRPSLLRDIIGFASGGLVAAITASLVYASVFGWPEPPSQANHNGEDSVPLLALGIVMVFCGGFIGRRGFSADFFSDLWPSIIASFVIVVFLCIVASLTSKEIATMVGFASVGIAASATVSLLLQHWYPQKTVA